MAETSATGENEAESGGPAKTVTYSMSPGFAGLFGTHQVGLAVTSYQSGKLYMLGQNRNGGLLVHERFFRKAMGLAVPEPGTLLLATLFQLITFRNVLEPGQAINETYDSCYVPRRTEVTGEVDAHDVGRLADGRTIFVNTAYNCLATPSERHSFTPVWKPPFISTIVREDRCHLNGLAMADGVPRYVTAVSRSDTIDGWRDRRSDGGVIIDVASSEIVTTGLSMAHSPRLYDGRLWVLNSGTGELGSIDLPTGRFEPVAFCPGFLRGLAFSGKFAFVGLSKPRYERFEGLPLDDRLRAADSEPWCGVQVIDLETGRCAHWFRIDGAVAELYDLAIVPGTVRPMALGFGNSDVLSLVTHEPLGASGFGASPA